MLSESARMSSAAEARFRIQAPNSSPRAITVIALDAPSDRVVRRLAEGSWSHATFLTAAGRAGDADSADGGTRGWGNEGTGQGTRVQTLGERQESPESGLEPIDGWLSDLVGRPRNLLDEVAAADLVVMVATPGGDGHAASIIGAACSLRRVMTTALMIGGTSASEEAVSKTLATLRPWSLMVVIAEHPDYIDDMLIALRA